MKKIFAGFVSASMVVMMLGAVVVPAPASAATVEELQALIASLTAQLSALQAQVGGSTTSGSTTFTSNLTVGSRGAEVTALQNFLVAKGYLVMPAGVAPGYFGQLTKSALAAYQVAKGIAPAAGYFGPLTRAQVNADQSTGGTTGGSTGSGALEGTDGNIADVDELAQYNNEEVGATQEDVKVLGMDVEASNDGDIAIKSIKVSFDPAGNASGDSDRLTDYVSGVKVWMGSTEIGSADADDFSKDSAGIYSKAITVKDAVIKSGDTEKIYVTVDGASNFDSGDIDSDSWTVDVENIRFEDGSGVITTDSTTGDINGMDVAIDFVSFSSASDTKLKILVSSNTPIAGPVMIDANNVTENVVLLKGKLTLEGTSDVLIDEFPVTFTVTGATGLASTTGNVTLKLGDEEYSESVGSAFNTLVSTVTFDNLDFTLGADESINFEVLADIEETAGDIDEGDTVTASVTASNREVMDVENEEGDQLLSAEKTGTAVGKAQEFRVSGITVASAVVSSSVTTGSSANDDVGSVSIKFKVTAVDETIYISSVASDVLTTAVTAGQTNVQVKDPNGTATVGGVSAKIYDRSSTALTMTNAGTYTVNEGETADFEVITTIQLPTAGAAGTYDVALNGISWSTDSTDETPNNAYTSNLNSYKGSVTLN